MGWAAPKGHGVAGRHARRPCCFQGIGPRACRRITLGYTGMLANAPAGAHTHACDNSNSSTQACDRTAHARRRHASAHLSCKTSGLAPPLWSTSSMVKAMKSSCSPRRTSPLAGPCTGGHSKDAPLQIDHTPQFPCYTLCACESAAQMAGSQLELFVRAINSHRAAPLRCA
jgi:hypothetical protein